LEIVHFRKESYRGFRGFHGWKSLYPRYPRHPRFISYWLLLCRAGPLRYQRTILDGVAAEFLYTYLESVQMPAVLDKPTYP
jgi:hypothetical protein